MFIYGSKRYKFNHEELRFCERIPKTSDFASTKKNNSNQLGERGGVVVCFVLLRFFRLRERGF